MEVQGSGDGSSFLELLLPVNVVRLCEHVQNSTLAATSLIN